ncbi:hypothetical protein [Allocoleopsis sp.]
MQPHQYPSIVRLIDLLGYNSVSYRGSDVQERQRRSPFLGRLSF